MHHLLIYGLPGAVSVDEIDSPVSCGPVIGTQGQCHNSSRSRSARTNIASTWRSTVTPSLTTDQASVAPLAPAAGSNKIVAALLYTTLNETLISYQGLEKRGLTKELQREQKH